jgi:pimeloyl-ACP methyl ester carboxylesterase
VAAVVSQVHERVLMLGQRKSLLGILAENPTAASDATRPVIIILNAGIIHRVGPSRVHVALARRLAGLGYATLRFDLSGVGDSERSPEARAPLDAALADIHEVLDSLAPIIQSRGTVLAGICSGADHAVIYAGSDPRVVGVVLVDPHIPRTRRYYLYYYGRRLFRLDSWLNVLLGRHPMWHSDSPGAIADETRPEASFIRELNSTEVRTFLQGAYRKANELRNQFLAVFTGGLEAQHCYREQLLHAFPQIRFGERLRLEYFKSADHTFASELERQRLINLVAEWVSRTRFPDPQSSSRT